MTDEHRNITAAREAEEARRVDDDYLSELQKVWRGSTVGYASAIEVDQYEPQYENGKRGGDGEALHEQVTRAVDEALQLRAEVKRLRASSAAKPGTVHFDLTLDQIRMVHHALANLGNTDPLKSDAFRELFDMIRAHVQAVAP